MKRRTFWMAALVVAGMAMTGCGNDETLNPATGEDSGNGTEQQDKTERDARINDYKFIVGANGSIQPATLQPMSAEGFQRDIVGYGWHSAGAHVINSDGTIEEKEYYSDIIGAGPASYFFDEQQFTSFFTAMDIPANCYMTTSYQYNEDDNAIALEGSHRMTVLSCADHLLTVLDTYDGKSPKLMFFQRMTDEELEATRKAYDKTMEEAEREAYK